MKTQFFYDKKQKSGDGLYRNCPICGADISGTMDVPIFDIEVCDGMGPTAWTDDDQGVEFSFSCNGDPEHTSLEMHEHYKERTT